MAAPPESSHTEGPICKVCGKPMNRHTYSQQRRCESEEKKWK